MNEAAKYLNMHINSKADARAVIATKEGIEALREHMAKHSDDWREFLIEIFEQRDMRQLAVLLLAFLPKMDNELFELYCLGTEEGNTDEVRRLALMMLPRFWNYTSERDKKIRALVEAGFQNPDALVAIGAGLAAIRITRHELENERPGPWGDITARPEIHAAMRFCEGIN